MVRFGDLSTTLDAVLWVSKQGIRRNQLIESASEIRSRVLCSLSTACLEKKIPLLAGLLLRTSRADWWHRAGQGRVRDGSG